MTNFSKRNFKKALIIGVALVCILYLGTMRRADGQEGSRLMTPAKYEAFYVGETGFENEVLAMAILPSTYTFNGGDGCPCYGIFKPLAMIAMLTTWEFFVNVLIFSCISYFLLERKGQLRSSSTRGSQA